MKTIINTTVPDFSVEAYVDGEFKKISRDDIAGKWAIFFFYPADFTFVCPTELLDMAENYDKFRELGAEVYAVSTDTQFTHKAWHDSSESISKVKFPMLADKTGYLSEAFGVLNPDDYLAYRGTFIVNPEGLIKVAEVNDNGIGRNSDELLRKLEAAQFVAEHGDQVCPARWRRGEKTLKPGIDLVGKI
ncbi:alkyl hydroperoxide reductase subunit C [uncultured Duncaniella sp.]|uniref:alkyl hydroperoxide reductase subunit C n=1 Tax=uncultured Duncaniella sp. TaxID=2768039 RepID=UPI0026E534D4|nr:alkyl hydroperoxide reductase subunit C [uncultured Duncaniella sp.]